MAHMYIQIVYCLSSSSGKPVISSTTTEFSGSTADNLSVILSITGTTPTVEVYREGALINNPRVEILFANTQFEMIISDLQQSDAGQYKIVAINDFMTAEITITVVPIGKSFFRSCYIYNYVMCMQITLNWC